MQLSNKLLDHLLDDIIKPDLELQKASIGMVHLGLGNFFRAHQCFFTQEAMRLDGGNWAYAAATLSSSYAIDSLKKQDFLYTHVRHGSNETKLQIMNIIKDAILLRENAEPFFQYLENPNICIITLTITEKGYYFEPASGQLLYQHPDIISDLQHFHQPKTAIGFLVEALRRRKAAINKGITILSCDNLPDNGKVTKNVIIQYAQKIDPDLASWIEQYVTFPSSMVDRITPMTTDDDRSWLKKHYGYNDDIMIQTESFSQWVIEDDFPYGRPKWEKAGVQMVDDVQAFEEMKLRLLNGTHSTMAYLGYLSGYKTIDVVINNKEFSTFIRNLMDEEITPSLNMPKNIDINAYKDALIKRYKNPNLKHSTYQIASDGSQKIPQRIIRVLQYQYQHGDSYIRLITSIAGWLYYIQACDEAGNRYEVSDPKSAEFKLLLEESHSDEEFIRKILAMDEIFGGFFDDKEELIGQILKQYEQLKKLGIIETIKNIG